MDNKQFLRDALLAPGDSGQITDELLHGLELALPVARLNVQQYWQVSSRIQAVWLIDLGSVLQNLFDALRHQWVFIQYVFEF